MKQTTIKIEKKSTEETLGEDKDQEAEKETDYTRTQKNDPSPVIIKLFSNNFIKLCLKDVQIKPAENSLKDIKSIHKQLFEEVYQISKACQLLLELNEDIDVLDTVVRSMKALEAKDRVMIQNGECLKLEDFENVIEEALRKINELEAAAKLTGLFMASFELRCHFKSCKMNCSLMMTRRNQINLANEERKLLKAKRDRNNINKF